MRMDIKPKEELVDLWIQSYVPEKDFFYLQNRDLIDINTDLNEVLVIAQDEFFGHDSYKQIQLVNSYEYWQRAKEVAYVIVADSEWVTRLPIQKKKTLLETQIKMGRGLILPYTFFPASDEIPLDYVVSENEDKRVVLQHDMWEKLPYQIKSHVIREYAKEWDQWSCYELPEEAPSHLKSYSNTFPALGGSNCLSATLFAITGQEWMIHEWVHPKTFVQGLTNAHYALTHDGLCEGDVVTWKNSAGMIQHASYHIGNNLFFNKNGQTFFNPWKVVSLNELNEEWDGFGRNVYRRKFGNK